ncbi:MAG: CCA tRNA nucleotidyltransferase [Ancalomicrobiaceae bacterium]|nr:CCA tRNA nucleotidyltransferase [Ancalomicrobiaceae bacterium]
MPSPHQPSLSDSPAAPATGVTRAPDGHLWLTPRSAAWLADRRLAKLMRVVAGEDEEIRVVGGAVRNALLGRTVSDIDLATTATPDVVMARAKSAGMKPVPTGIDHGTVTVVVDAHPFEVTTLREDVETHGRRATVRFGRDWSADARRRDFTINALYATADGEVVDLVGGISDCLERRIRFIGSPQDRIREDYLRILRFFRFHAIYGDGQPDAGGLAACIALADGIATLSAERIGQEMLKLVVAEASNRVLQIMAETGILRRIADFDADVAALARLNALLGQLPAEMRPTDDAGLRLAALCGESAAAALHLAERMRLSNAMRDRMVAAIDLSKTVGDDCDERAVRALVFKAGNQRTRDCLLVAACRPTAEKLQLRLPDLIVYAASFQRPHLPVNGRDLIRHGLVPGPDVGAAIATLSERWIDSDFTLDRDRLIATLAPDSPIVPRR